VPALQNLRFFFSCCNTLVSHYQYGLNYDCMQRSLVTVNLVNLRGGVWNGSTRARRTDTTESLARHGGRPDAHKGGRMGRQEVTKGWWSAAAHGLRHTVYASRFQRVDQTSTREVTPQRAPPITTQLAGIPAPPALSCIPSSDGRLVSTNLELEFGSSASFFFPMRLSSFPLGSLARSLQQFVDATKTRPYKV
jgi:hypothetical protein